MRCPGLLRLSAFIIIFFAGTGGFSAAAGETVTVKGACVKKGETAQRWVFSSSLSKVVRDGRTIYKSFETGRGDYDKYKEVNWEINAEMEMRDGVLQPLYTVRTIKDKDGGKVVSFKKSFDYEEGKVYFEKKDANGNVTEEKTFSIKGYITDNNTMTYFLPPFIKNHDKKEYEKFYLVSSEPKLYKIKTKYIANETLELPSGKVDTVKLQLIPQLGFLTGISKMIVPPTFAWHGAEPPYAWYQYEGLETGLSSPTIVSSVREVIKAD